MPPLPPPDPLLHQMIKVSHLVVTKHNDGQMDSVAGYASGDRVCDVFYLRTLPVHGATGSKWLIRVL